MTATIDTTFQAKTRRELDMILVAQMDTERSSFISHWRDIADYILPRRARFSVTDVNKGDKRNQKIIDGTATLAQRTLKSGMMAGLTSPARPWFRLTVPDDDLSEVPSVNVWLHDVTRRMNNVMLKSNLYNSLPQVYGDMGNFGTGCMFVEPDAEKVFRTYVFPIGSYMLANDHKNRVRVFARDFRLTVRQVVMKFSVIADDGKPDMKNISQHVIDLWKQGMTEVWVDICHVIQPNPDFNPNKSHSKYKRYVSRYYEVGTAGDKSGKGYLAEGYDVYLSESGYDFFPILAPRWQTTGEDVYGTDCPGMTALGDVRQLQVEQKRKAQGIEKGINPAMVAPTSMRKAKTSIIAGDITFTDEREGTKGFRKAHDVQLDLGNLIEDIRDIRNIIRRAYYEDLFLMIAQSDRRTVTATEINERVEEKNFSLGPLLEQSNGDLYDPLMDIIYFLMDERGMIPPPPPELEGRDIKAEYISIMAQSQKMVGVSVLERYSSFASEIGTVTQDRRAMLKTRWDEVLDDYADRSGINPKLMRSDEEIDEIMEREAQQAQQARVLQGAEMAGKAAKSLSEAKLTDDNALKRLVGAGK
jgi:hypothetical protein